MALTLVSSLHSSPEADYISFNQFMAFMKEHWHQPGHPQAGQHICILGPTGCGKTFLNASLLGLRQYVVVVATKANDKTLSEQYNKYAVVHNWKDRHWTQKKVLFWPEVRTIEEGKKIYPSIHTLLESVYIEKRWTLAIDDLKKVVYDRTCKEDMQVLLTQARSQDISIVTNAQSPIGIKVMEALDQASFWLMFHQNDDDRNCDRLSSITGVNYKRLLNLNSRLEKYEFILVSTESEPVIVRRKA